MNPYESPQTAATKYEPNRGKTAVDVRLAGGLLRIFAIVPHVLVIDGILRQGLFKDIDPHDPRTWISLVLAYCSFCLSPLVGCGLLGLACWRRSWQVAYIAGLVLFVGMVACCGVILVAP